MWRPLPFLSFPHGRGGGSALSLPLSWVVNSLFSQTSLSGQLSEDAGTQSGIDGQVFVAMPCYKCSHDRICMVSKIQQYGWTHNFKRIKHCMGFTDSSLRPPLHGLISEGPRESGEALVIAVIWVRTHNCNSMVTQYPFLPRSLAGHFLGAGGIAPNIETTLPLPLPSCQAPCALVLSRVSQRGGIRVATSPLNECAQRRCMCWGLAGKLHTCPNHSMPKNSQQGCQLVCGSQLEVEIKLMHGSVESPL